MDGKSRVCLFFSEEWRQCLREQYKNVIQTGDQVTLPSLTAVMQQVGFTEDELRQLAVTATMHIDDLPDEFVPDLEILQPPEQSFQPHPLECQCPECVQINLVPHDEEGQPLEDDALEELIEMEAELDDDDAPQQLTMF